MKTLTVLIGNSDNKLTQLEWSKFHSEIETLLASYWKDCYFAACSEGSKPWQNSCWVVSVQESDLTYIEKGITMLREDWKQDSVAITVADTKFV